MLAASPAAVWAVLTQTDRYPDWNPLVSKLKGTLEVGATIRVAIVPLGQTFKATIVSHQPNQELVWEGIQGAAWLLKGRHYYRLVPQPNQQTLLEHGEYFTGLLAYCLPSFLLKRMKQAFVDHNNALQQQLQHEQD